MSSRSTLGSIKVLSVGIAVGFGGRGRISSATELGGLMDWISGSGARLPSSVMDEELGLGASTFEEPVEVELLVAGFGLERELPGDLLEEAVFSETMMVGT